MKVTLAKALKLRKRLVERIAKVSADIQTYNHVQGIRVLNADGSVKTEAKFVREVDVLKLVEEREDLKKKLVDLKVALNRGNQKQQEKILLLSELKDSLTFYRGLPVTTGDDNGFSYRENTVTVHDSVLKKADVDKKVDELQKLLDQTQEEIEAFNWKTQIEVPDLNF